MGFIKRLIEFFLLDEVNIELGNKKRSQTENNKKHSEVYISVDETSKKTIENVVNSLFKGEEYCIRTNMALNGQEDGYKCSYVIFDEEDNIKMIIQLVPHNGDKNRGYYNLKKVCEVNNIPFVNFYTHMKNDKAYVEERIKSKL